MSYQIADNLHAPTTPLCYVSALPRAELYTSEDRNPASSHLWFITDISQDGMQRVTISSTHEYLADVDVLAICCFVKRYGLLSNCKEQLEDENCDK